MKRKTPINPKRWRLIDTNVITYEWDGCTVRWVTDAVYMHRKSSRVRRIAYRGNVSEALLALEKSYLIENSL